MSCSLRLTRGLSRLAVPEIQPDVVVITNIFRDQSDRYGELYSVANALDKMLKSCQKPQLLCSMATILRSQTSAKTQKPGKCISVWRPREIGMPVPEQSADIIRCIHCGADFLYEIAYLSHLGIYRCPECGYTLPNLDVAVTSAALASNGEGPSHIKLRTPLGELKLEIPLPGVHNIYNAAAAISAAIAAGFTTEKVQNAMNGLRTAFGRMEKI